MVDASEVCGKLITGLNAMIVEVVQDEVRLACQERGDKSFPGGSG